MDDLLLRPEQDLMVLRAENDPHQREEVKRVDRSDKGRVIECSPEEYQRAILAGHLAAQQQAAYRARVSRQQAWAGSGFQWGSYTTTDELADAGLRANRVSIPGDWDYGKQGQRPVVVRSVLNQGLYANGCGSRVTGC